jgi:hypothetical protein
MRRTTLTREPEHFINLKKHSRSGSRYSWKKFWDPEKGVTCSQICIYFY